MSSTAGLVKTTLDYNASGVVKYNMKTSKTIGHWQDQKQPLTQQDLIGFYGTANHPGMTIHQQGNLLINKINNNVRMSDAYSKKGIHHLLYGDNRKRSVCHTVVQSFDYKDNPNLTPKQVHIMGIEMIHGIHNYLKDKYGYNLDGGMISTHIDRNKTGFSQKDQMYHTKHLHNHIVIPSYNQQGNSISPYLRKQDLYAFQRINDQICIKNGLKDYHFLKLNRQIQPSTSFTKFRSNRQYIQHLSNKIHKENQHITKASRKIKDRKGVYTKSSSYVQRAILRFNKANNYAFDKSPNNFNKAKKIRNKYLQQHYGLQIRKVNDPKTNKKVPRFTMKDFKPVRTKTTSHSPWYDMYCLRLLAWHDEKQERCERMIKQFDFSQVNNKPVKYLQYKQTIRNAVKQLPPLNHLTSAKEREDHIIKLQVPKASKSASDNKSIKHIGSTEDFERYLHQTKFQMDIVYNPQTLNGLNADTRVDNLDKYMNKVRNKRTQQMKVQNQKQVHARQVSNTPQRQNQNNAKRIRLERIRQARRRGLQR